MKRETGILQDRVEIAALERCVGNTHEWVRSRQNEKMKCGGNPSLHGERISFQGQWQIGAEYRYQRAEEGEDRHPQHHRAFVIAPDAGEPVDQRHLRIGILIDIEHREIRDDITKRQRAKCTSAAGTAMSMSAESLVRVPTIGITPWIRATPSASINAKWPSSGIIWRLRRPAWPRAARNDPSSAQTSSRHRRPLSACRSH